MDAEPGHSLIAWTVRACVVLYALAVRQYVFHGVKNPAANPSVYRTHWTLAWLLCVLHVVCAFHFKHGWSHGAALTHTATVTERGVGINWGGGLYFNYLFLIWWGMDVLRLHRRLTTWSSPSLHVVSAFMMINATVVFGPRWWIIPVSAFVLLLLSELRFRSDGGDEIELP